MPSIAQRLRPVLCLLPLLCSGCATMGLWGHEWRPRIDRATGEDEGAYVPVLGTRWEWWRIALRVVATPVTLAADAVAALPGAILEGLTDGGDGHAGACAHADSTPSLPPQPHVPTVPLGGKHGKPGKPMLSGVRR